MSRPIGPSQSARDLLKELRNAVVDLDQEHWYGALLDRVDEYLENR